MAHVDELTKTQKANVAKILDYERAHIQLLADNDKLKHMISVLEGNNKMYSERVDKLDEFSKYAIQLAHNKQVTPMPMEEYHPVHATAQSTSEAIVVDQFDDGNQTI